MLTSPIPNTGPASERRVVGAMWLVEAFFVQGVQRWTTWPTDITWGANTFRGLGQLGQVAEIKESEAGAGDKVNLTLSPVAQGLLPLALGSVESYRGRPINIYLWAVGPNYQPIGSPILRHFGVMDQVSIKRDKDQGSVELSCMQAGANGLRKSLGLRVNNAQHQARFPADRGFEYTAGLLNNPQLWLSKRFQEV